MGCCQSKQHPKGFSDSEESGEHQTLLNGSSSQDEEGKGSEYNISHLPPDHSPPLLRSAEDGYGSTTGEGSARRSQPSLAGDVLTSKGKQIMAMLREAYGWRNEFNHPSQEFLSRMDKLYMECQLHLTSLSSQDQVESRREADVIVDEMVRLRNYWGPELLPSSVCNAFVRERITLMLGSEEKRQFRIDCAQFFDPVPFYGNQQGNPGELMKLYRFSVYDVAKNEVILRYYLERSNVIQLYHVLCYTLDSYRGQVHPYGSEQPAYWELRQHMLEDVQDRVLGILHKGRRTPTPRPHAISAGNVPASLPEQPLANAES